jgi:hypothetical protein
MPSMPNGNETLETLIRRTIQPATDDILDGVRTELDYRSHIYLITEGAHGALVKGWKML